MVALVLRNPANGQVVFDSSTITAHIRGAFTTSASAGSIGIPGLSSTGLPFVLSAVPIGGTLSSFPKFTINGDTVSWTAAGVACRVVMASRC